jgi:hypothetical protein
LLADVFKDKIEPAGGVLLDARRDANPARLGQPFEAGCDIDPVAKDVAILDNDIAHIDADAEFDAVVGLNAGVAPGHLALHVDRTAKRIDDAAKLDEQPVAGGFDQTALVLGDFRIEEIAPQRFEAPPSSAPISRE